MNIYSHLGYPAQRRVRYVSAPQASDIDVMNGVQVLKPELGTALMVALAGMHWLVPTGPGIQSPDVQTYSVVSEQRYQQLTGGAPVTPHPVGFPSTITSEPIIVDAEALRVPGNSPILNEISVLVARTPEVAAGIATSGTRWAVTRPLSTGTQPVATPAKKRNTPLLVAAGVAALAAILIATS